MPILAPGLDPVEGLLRRVYRLPGLPDFNSTDTAFTVSAFEGFRDVSVPDVQLVPNGGGPGAVLVGEPESLEAYYTLKGLIQCPERSQMLEFRSKLLAAVRYDQPLAVFDAAGGLDQQVFVTLYDKPEITFAGPYIRFSLPLVAPDPYKYALQPLSGEMGVWTGQQWYRTYTDSGSAWVRTYVQNEAGRWVRTYVQQAPDGPYPLSLPLTPDGDVASRRLTFEVSGPLTAGDWFVLEESSGRSLYADLGLTAAQTLTFDCKARTAKVNGADVSHLVFGDWLALEPGQNTFRLVSGTYSAGHARVEALEAYL